MGIALQLEMWHLVTWPMNVEWYKQEIIQAMLDLHVVAYTLSGVPLILL